MCGGVKLHGAALSEVLRIAVLEGVVHDRQEPRPAVRARGELVEEAEGAQIRFLKQILSLFLVPRQIETGGVDILLMRERPVCKQCLFLVLPCSSCSHVSDK